MEDKVGSDDDDLPCLTEVFDRVSDANIKLDKIRKGDMVYAYFQNSLWPALVRNVYKSERKVTVWYLDAPGKTMKVPLKKVRSFYDPHVKDKIQNSLPNNKVKEFHEQLVDRALIYLTRKSQGIVDDPLKFFNDEPYLIYHRMFDNKEEILKEGLDDGASNLNDQVMSDDSISLHSNDSEIKQCDIENPFLRNVFSFEKEEDKMEVCSIISVIKSGYVDSHLLSVKDGVTPSVWQQRFDDPVEHQELKSNLVESGPVKSLQNLKEIYTYLLNFYRKKFIHNVQFADDTECISLVVNYIIYVWIPESVMRAICILTNISVYDLIEIFYSKYHDVLEKFRSKNRNFNASDNHAFPSKLNREDILKLILKYHKPIL